MGSFPEESVRRLTVSALVDSGAYMLGSIPMEDMDVVLLPREQTIDVNPESPFIAKKKVK